MFNMRREIEWNLGIVYNRKGWKASARISVCEAWPSGDVSVNDLCELSHQAALMLGAFGILFSSER